MTAQKVETESTHPEIKPGMTVRIHQKIKELNPKGELKERIQVFEGIVIARHRKIGNSATFTVRKISEKVGVEKIFPINLPSIAKIEIIRQAQVRQAQPRYLRTHNKRLKEKTAAKSK